MDEVYATILNITMVSIEIHCAATNFWVPRGKIKDGHFYDYKDIGSNQILEIDSDYCADKGIY